MLSREGPTAKPHSGSMRKGAGMDEGCCPAMEGCGDGGPIPGGRRISASLLHVIHLLPDDAEPTES